jgi:hypothetical protein
MASWCEWLSPCEWRPSTALGLKIFRVLGKGGEPTPGVGWAAGLDRPAQAHFGPVPSPLRSHGSSGDYALCPFYWHDFDDVILASKMEVLFA